MGVQEVVMESTARYWRPVWVALEATGVRKHLAHAHSNGARRGRKSDFGTPSGWSIDSWPENWSQVMCPRMNSRVGVV